MDLMNWRARAACRLADPELFFPEGTASAAPREIAAAKQICSGCLVQTRCLDWALHQTADFGIWGGRTEEERRAFRVLLAQRHR
jgi:WhiB family transcriptional regulator, redox-sensing transcriptional regulator